MSTSYQIYDGKLTVIPRQLVEQKEVKADDVGILYRVCLFQDAAKNNNMDHDEKRNGKSPVEEVADGIRAVLEKKAEH